MADPAAADTTDAADVPPNGSPAPGREDRLDVEAVGRQMSEQFLELLGLWTQQMTALAEVGVDPTPLVRSLARTLRSAASQLDPHPDGLDGLDGLGGLDGPGDDGSGDAD
jgi:hypothetical protein